MMLRNLRARGLVRKARADEGASAVEFALVLPVLILILFGIIEFGVAFAQQLSLNSGARQGARLGVVGDKTCGDVAAAAIDAAQAIGLDTTKIVVTTSINNAPDCASATDKPCLGHRGDPLKVALSYPGSISIPLYGNVSVAIKGQGEFRCEANQ